MVSGAARSSWYIRHSCVVNAHASVVEARRRGVQISSGHERRYRLTAIDCSVFFYTPPLFSVLSFALSLFLMNMTGQPNTLNFLFIISFASRPTHCKIVVTWQLFPDYCRMSEPEPIALSIVSEHSTQ